MRERTLRWAVVCLALTGPGFVVCDSRDGDQYEQYHLHELTLSCPTGGNPPAENVVLAVGAVSATSAARSCLDTTPDADQVPAAELTSDGATLRFGSASEPGAAETITLLATCSYEIDVEPAEPATCAGTVTWNLLAELRIPGLVDAPLTIVAEKRTSGPEPDSFDATVRVACSAPDQEVVVATDGIPDDTLRLEATDGACDVEIAIDGAASAVGESVHQVMVRLIASAKLACRSDGDCVGGERCSSASLRCTSGSTGSACFSPYDASTSAGDCGPAAPFCSPLGQCHDGRDGDRCGSTAGQSDAHCDAVAGYACVGDGLSATCQPTP